MRKACLSLVALYWLETYPGERASARGLSIVVTGAQSHQDGPSSRASTIGGTNSLAEAVIPVLHLRPYTGKVSFGLVAILPEVILQHQRFTQEKIDRVGQPR